MSNDEAVEALYLLSQISPARDAAVPRFRALALPQGIRYLHIGRHGHPELGERAAGRQASLAVEVTGSGAQLVLLVLRSAHAGALRVNGHAATRVSLLRSGDQLLVDGHLLFLATYRRPPIGPATDDQVGKECALCRARVRAGDQVYACPCGSGPLHWQSGVGQDHEQTLECATLVRECAACKRPLVLDERWEDVPGGL